MDLREAQRGGLTRHPWEVARFRFFWELLRRHGACARPVNVLDVGSGDGWFSTQLLANLPSGSHIDCWDTGYPADAGPSEEEGITRTGVKPAVRADILLLLDVLEHVDDDARFLSTLVRENTHPQSTVLVSVPAWPALYTSHDDFLKHFRRYSPASGAELLETAGLRIDQRGGLFHSLLAPRSFAKVVEVTRGRLGYPPKSASHAQWHGGPLATRLVAGALALDIRASLLLAQWAELPGLSWWALCTTR